MFVSGISGSDIDLHFMQRLTDSLNSCDRYPMIVLPYRYNFDLGLTSLKVATLDIVIKINNIVWGLRVYIHTITQVMLLIILAL